MRHGKFFKYLKYRDKEIEYQRDFANSILTIWFLGTIYIQDPTKNQFDFLGTMMMSFHRQVQTNQLLK